jgi:hypothetical protein
MTPVSIALVGLATAAIAALWPIALSFLGRPAAAVTEGIPPAKRADWVNKLFALAAEADTVGEAGVAVASRALITALISHQDASKRGK